MAVARLRRRHTAAAVGKTQQQFVELVVIENLYPIPLPAFVFSFEYFV